MFKISPHFYDLLFNAYIFDLFYDIDDLDFASFSDVLGQLKLGIDKTFDWFKRNADKFHLIISSKTSVGMEVPNFTVRVCLSEKITPVQFFRII